MPTFIVVNNLAQLVRRANKLDDPRNVFYRAVLASKTYEEYMEMVGDVYVVPPTYPEQMGAQREYNYMLGNRRWIAEQPVPDGQGAGPAVDGFRPDPALDARQRVLREVVQRQGQARFREEMLRIYENRCAVTGCTVTPILEAAHVTPYRGEHTNDPTNGILLRTDIHSLWDLGLLAAEPATRTVWVSPSVKVDASYKALHGIALREPNPPELRPSAASLESQWAFVQDVERCR